VQPGRNPAELLTAGLRELTGKPPEAEKVAALLAFLDLLAHWSRSYNLTAVRDPAAMVTRHLLDSLSVLPWIHGPRLLDAGSGAGLPGIPLAIAGPELLVTLLDSAGKKTRFQNHVRRRLGLRNVRVVQGRLEDYRPEQAPNEVISRAFASLASFATAARHLGAQRLLAMKGRYPEDELETLPPWVRVDAVEKLQVPGLQEERHLVIMSGNP
jgi:16S rRNA (guanine527-N7)-methyltransferase